MTLQELISTSWFVPLCLLVLFIAAAYIKFKFFYSEESEYEDGEDHTSKRTQFELSESNKEIVQILDKLEDYLKQSKVDFKDSDTHFGEVRNNLTNYNSTVPFVVDYPSLRIPHKDKKSIVTFNIISGVQDIINENATSRASDRFNDYLVPYMQIHIPEKPEKQFMLAGKTPDLLRAISTEQHKYNFNDDELDKQYFLEPKSDNLPDDISKTIGHLIKKLPFFNSIYFHKNISLSMPFESIDFNNPSQIRDIYNTLLDIYDLTR